MNNVLQVGNVAVWSWGVAADGQLGFCPANSEICSKPVQVKSLDGYRVVYIAHGSRHSLFLTRDGSVLSCGMNNVGQLGCVTTAECDLQIPTIITALQSHVIRTLHTGSNFCVAVNSKGQVLSWGDNSAGQLGREGAEHGLKVIPRMLPYVVKQVACGIEHVLALCQDSALIVWGSNDKGQLGVGLDVPSTSMDEIVNERNVANSTRKGLLPQMVTTLSGE